MGNGSFARVDRDEMQTIYYVSVFVVRPTGSSHELLLGRRAPDLYMGGTWQLISGGIEPGETGWQAALREVREESGLAVSELYRLSQMTQFYRADRDCICIAPMFAAIVAADARVVINPEHTELSWVAIESAEARLMWPGDRTALAELRDTVLGNGPAKPYMKILI